MTTVGELLAASGLPALEARALLAHALATAREALLAHPERPVDGAAAAAFRSAATRRRNGVPLAYLLGEKEFYSRRFVVTPDVLVPRPETELLVDLALEQLRGCVRPRVLDLGTGSGCIAITIALECPGADVVATDVSPAALAIATDNARRHGVAVRFACGSWYAALSNPEPFDLIVSNPPYVAAGDPHLEALRHEPAGALTDGADGLSCLTAIIAGAARYLAASGTLIVEHGYDQGSAVQALCTPRGWSARSIADGAGQSRVLVAQRLG